MFDFHDLITSYVAYFSTWQPHENRVFGTQFISLINKRVHKQNISDKRRRQKEKKKKKKKTQAACTMRDPSQAARTVRDPHQQSLHPLATMAEVKVSCGQVQILLVLEHQSDLKQLSDPVWHGRSWLCRFSVV